LQLLPATNPSDRIKAADENNGGFLRGASIERSKRPAHILAAVAKKSW